MKRFANFKNIYAQSTPTSNPPVDVSKEFEQAIDKLGLPGQLAAMYKDKNSYLYQIAFNLWQKGTLEKAELYDAMWKNVEDNTRNEGEAEKLLKSNGYTDDEIESFFDVNIYGVPKYQIASLVVDLYPKLKAKSCPFDIFKALLEKSFDRFSNNVGSIKSFFDTLVNNIDASTGLTSSAGVFVNALKFLSSDKATVTDWEDYLFGQQVLKNIFTGTPIDPTLTNKANVIGNKLSSLRAPLTKMEEIIKEQSFTRGVYLDGFYQWYKETARFFRINQQLFELDWIEKHGSSLQEDMKHLPDILKIFLEAPAASEPVRNLAGDTFKVEKSSVNHFRTVIAEDPRVQAERDRVTEITNTFTKMVDTSKNKIDQLIAMILKKNIETPVETPFGSKRDVFIYLPNTQRSQAFAQDIFKEINRQKEILSERRDSLKSQVLNNGLNIFSPGSSGVVGNIQAKGVEVLDKEYNFAILNLNQSKLKIEVSMIIVNRQNEVDELNLKYNKFKNLFTIDKAGRKAIGAILLATGFKIADIIDSIADQFKEKAVGPFAEIYNKNFELWKNFALEQRIKTVNDAEPGLADILGLPTFKQENVQSTSLAKFTRTENKRFAEKFEIQSDQKFKDYWNNLFMQSLDPRPMGDIIEEKPKHGNLTTKDDAKLHKDTMRKFKKSRFKKK